jgi:precorrin-2/cobalt-factor-2 C20-methyltransferase
VQKGILYGISVGTGDPELITVKGSRILQKSSVIAFPQGVGNKPGIAETIILSYIQPHQVKLPLHFPYVQDELILTQAWQKTATQVWSYLNKGENVAFACEGDVSFYSTFSYLAHYVKQLCSEVEIQVIPGVSSPMAAAAVLSLPLTQQNERLVVLPALYRVCELEKALDFAEVVVLLKFSSVYEQIWQVLKQRNLFNRAWIVEKATFPEQKIYDNLEDYPSLKLSYFSILIIKR